MPLTYEEIQSEALLCEDCENARIQAVGKSALKAADALKDLMLALRRMIMRRRLAILLKRNAAEQGHGES